MPTFIVDRIEGDTMVVINQDTEETLDLPHALAPNLKEGDAFSISQQDTTTQLSESEERLARLKAKSPQPSTGDIIDL